MLTETQGTLVGLVDAVDVEAFSARAAISSVVLGSRSPELPVRTLVRAAQLFGVSASTARVAISRMASSGELVAAGDGIYAVSGVLAKRRAEVFAARKPAILDWDGTWSLAVVHGEGRSRKARTSLRELMRFLRMGELREGVWVRPSNIDLTRLNRVPPEVSVIHGGRFGHGGADIVWGLWPLDEWAEVAAKLLDRLTQQVPATPDAVLQQLPRMFVLGTKTMRHLADDPLLPPELLPRDWPGYRLRAEFEELDRAVRLALKQWYRDEAATPGREHDE